MKRWVGDFRVSASLTIFTTRASAESPDLRVTSIFDRAAAVDGAGEHARSGIDTVGAYPRRRGVLHGSLVDRNAFAGHRRLVHAGGADHEETVGRHALVGLDQHDVADGEFLDRDLLHLPVAAHDRRVGRQFGQCLDRGLARPIA
ncbi:MAG: hypothetical protein R3F10_05925 [Lysobacteraceae bacterium]